MLFVALTSSATALGQDELKVGYAAYQTLEGPAPQNASGLFQFKNLDGTVVWEAGVEASGLTSQGTLLVDQMDGNRTALALVNARENAINIHLRLRDKNGAEWSSRTVGLEPSNHFALFVDELFPGLPQGFLGTLHFETITNAQVLAGITLRQNLNINGEAIYATLPVLTQTNRRTHFVLPQVGSGNDLETEILIHNPSPERQQGRIDFYSSDGTHQQVTVDGESKQEIRYDLSPLGCAKFTLERQPETAVGYAFGSPDQGEAVPRAAAIFRYRQPHGPVSEAGILDSEPNTSFRLIVDNRNTRSGIALANISDRANQITFHLRDQRGQRMGTVNRELAPKGHLAIFVDELFPTMPSGFLGVLVCESSALASAIALKLTQTHASSPVVTTLSLNVTQSGASPMQALDSDLLYFPHVGFGSGLSTRLLFVGQDSGQHGGVLRFFQSNGTSMRLRHGATEAADFNLRMDKGGARDFSAGPLVEFRGIIFDVGTGSPISGALFTLTELNEQAVSDSKGDFSLLINEELLNCCEPIEASVCAPGYARKLLTVENPRSSEQGVIEQEVLLTESAESNCGPVPSIEIRKVSIPGDEISFNLTPVAAKGQLLVDLLGPGVTHRVAAQEVFSGTYTFGFQLDNLPANQFDKIAVTWLVGGSQAWSEVGYRFKVLGNYFHTRYNIPNEEQCTGTLLPFCFTSGDCVITSCAWNTNGNGRSEWISEVKENGSGRSQTLGFMSLEWFCSTPLGCSTSLRRLGDIQGCPSCPSGYLEAGETVAVRSDHPDLGCGDMVYVLGEGIRTVTDKGQLPSLSHLDHFAGISGCNAPPSIGSRVTVKLFEPDIDQSK